MRFNIHRLAGSMAGLLLLLGSFANCSHATVGATTPFISYEAEAGNCSGGAGVVSLTASPTTPYSSPELEASGHAYVQLTATGQAVTWTNNSSQNFTAINVRSCIPDATNGGGIVSSIDLYVNGVFRQAFSVNSQQNYCYEGTNYNGQTDKNPADGNPRGFWNDTHAFVIGAPLAPGDTITLQKDAANTAVFYYVDVVDLETPPEPLAQPANSLSILNYGAISNNLTVDNTAAINTCFSAARTQEKIAWIPPGTYCISAINGGLNADGITIAGAGVWYSTLYRVVAAANSQGVVNIITTTSCTLRDVSLDCNGSSRAGNNNNGAVNFSGTNWLVDDVWIQHATSAFWCAGVGGTARNCRVLSVWSDGGNFNNVQSDDGIGMNLTYSNNFVRGTGDDAMAINSVNYNVNGNTTNFYTMMSNITYANNTALAPWGGKCIGIYGGINDAVTNNLLCDTARYIGLGVMKFGVNGSDLLSATVTGNVVLRCGGNGYSQQQQAMMIGNGGDGQSVGTVANAYCASNTIIDSLYDAVGFSTSSNIVFQFNTIINPALDAIAAGPPDLGTAIAGNALIYSNTVIGLNAGQVILTNDAIRYATVIPIAATGFNTSANVQTEICAEGGFDMAVQNGAYAAYNNVSLNSANTFVARLASASSGGVIEIHLDSPGGTLVGTCAVPVSGGTQVWTNTYCSIGGASGTHDVYLVFTGGGLFSLEYFALYSAPPGPSHQLLIGNTYSLKSLANGNYVTAANGGTNALIAQGSSVGPEQEFKIIDAGGGNIGFQAVVNGEYVTADNAGSSPLIANRTGIGSWETFTEVDAGHGNIGLLAMANGKYVSTPNNGAGALIAASTAIGAQESFAVGFVSGIPPGVPGNLTAVPENSSVVLNWTASPMATSYNVKSSLSSGGPYTVIASNLTGLGYTNSGLSNGTIYYYVASAVSVSGESSNSTEAAVAPQANLAVWFEGDLIVNLQSTDLNPGGRVWTNHSSHPQSVGDFTVLGGNNLNVVTLMWNGQTVNTLFVDATGNNSAQSAQISPAEISANKPVSVEAWIYAADANPTSCYFNYGYQGGSGSPMNEREFNYDTSGHGVVSGNFGNFDTAWVKSPTMGWHHVAVIYDGATLKAYVDGSLNVTHAIGATLATVPTLMQIGSAIAGTGSNGGNDPFHGYIACARVQSGVLTAGDVAANFAAGPLATATAATPGGVNAIAGNNQVTVQWNTSVNATNYNVKRATNADGPYITVATNVNALNFTNAGLVNGTVYYFVVSAINAAGESVDSIVTCAHPVSITPPQLSFGFGNGQVQIAWPQDHTGWRLQTQTNSRGTGLGTNWVDVAASINTNQITSSGSLMNGSVFFRLVYP